MNKLLPLTGWIWIPIDGIQIILRTEIISLFLLFNIKKLQTKTTREFVVFHRDYFLLFINRSGRSIKKSLLRCYEMVGALSVACPAHKNKILGPFPCFCRSCRKVAKIHQIRHKSWESNQLGGSRCTFAPQKHSAPSSPAAFQSTHCCFLADEKKPISIKALKLKTWRLCCDVSFFSLACICIKDKQTKRCPVATITNRRTILA